MIGSDTKRGHIPETVVRYDPPAYTVHTATFIPLQASRFAVTELTDKTAVIMLDDVWPWVLLVTPLHIVNILTYIDKLTP